MGPLDVGYEKFGKFAFIIICLKDSKSMWNNSFVFLYFFLFFLNYQFDYLRCSKPQNVQF